MLVCLNAWLHGFSVISQQGPLRYSDMLCKKMSVLSWLSSDLSKLLFNSFLSEVQYFQVCACVHMCTPVCPPFATCMRISNTYMPSRIVDALLRMS